MQKKVNYIIWAICLCLMIVFGMNYLINKDKLKEYRFTYTNPYNIDVRIYLKDNKLGNELIDKLKKLPKNKNQFNYMNSLKSTIKSYKVDKYLIQCDDDVYVGNSYDDSKYKIATYYANQELFKIFNATNKKILTFKSNSDEFDQLIIIGDSDDLEEIGKQAASLMSVNDSKKYTEIFNDEVYWLKGGITINSYNASNQKSNKK